MHSFGSIEKEDEEEKMKEEDRTTRQFQQMMNMRKIPTWAR